MLKVLFIEPKSPNLHIFTQFSLPRLGSIILATIARQAGWEAKVIMEEEVALDWDEIASSDLVAISTITPTAPRAYAISDRVRRLGIPTILGGPHVTFLSEEALTHADFVIRGEGEIPFRAFLEVFISKKWKAVPALCYWLAGHEVINPMLEGMCNLDDIPYPDFSLLISPLRRIAGYKIIPIQTSRGCPFDCGFCSVTGMFGKKYRYRSCENVIKELQQYNTTKNFIFFYDDNFAANLTHTRDLLQRMIAEKFKFRWSTQVRTDSARDEGMIKLMRRAGCHTVFIGFESVNPASLQSMQKKQTLTDIRLAAQVFRKHGIHVHGMFVYGFDDDDWQTVRHTVKFAKRSKLTSSQFLILTPLPGTRAYEQLAHENRIKFHDWSLYDAHHVVFQPKRFTLDELQKAQILSHKRFYSLIESLKRVIAFRWVDLGIAHYARRINSLWKKKNRTYLRILKLLRPKREEWVNLDYGREINIE